MSDPRTDDPCTDHHPDGEEADALGVSCCTTHRTVAVIMRRADGSRLVYRRPYAAMRDFMHAVRAAYQDCAAAEERDGAPRRQDA